MIEFRPWAHNATSGAILTSPLFPATYHVDATGGNDANDGLSPEAPWQTIGKVNGETFRPGDTVLFKRGETWNGTITIPSPGVAGALISMGAYGIGAAPILDGGVNAAIQATAAARGYWRIQDLDIRCTGDVEDGSRGIHQRAGVGWDEDVPGWIIENCTFNCGILINGSNNSILNNVFDGAGNAEAENMLMAAAAVCTSLLVEGNTVRNCVARGMWLQGIGSNPIVRDNIVHDITAGAGAEGYGIDIDGVAGVISGALAEGNRVYDTDGAGLEFENCDGGPIGRNNIISGCGTEGIEIYARDAVGAVPDMRGVNTGGQVYNNLVYECFTGITGLDTAGWDIWQNTFADCTDTGFLVYPTLGHPEYMADISFKDNIITNGGELITFREDWDVLADHDYNRFFGANNKFVRGGPYTEMTLAQFQTETGQEANSTWDNPDFVNPGTDDYHLQAGSPCIGTGIDVGVTTDLDDVARGDPPDIGAYEYVA